MLRRWESEDLDALVRGVITGSRLHVARALRCVDDAPAVGRSLAARLHAGTGRAHVVGITGNPGAGKSTVVDILVQHLRALGKAVAVLAIDPSSPYSGGAVLGDRIRMQRHHADDGVFIRSLATRGSLGGLSAATFESVRVLDAAGYDAVLVETVGVGQDEVDVARLAHTTVVVLVPGLGDDVQAIKAGLLEVADIFAINKADRDGVGQLERSLRQMMGLLPSAGAWEVPVARTVATSGQGIDGLWGHIAAHADFLAGPQGVARQQSRTRHLFDRLLDAALVERGRHALRARLTAVAQDIDAGADAYALVDALMDTVAQPGQMP